MARITLSRPEKKSPLTFESYAELRVLFRAFEHEREIHAIVPSGAGGNFFALSEHHHAFGWALGQS